MRVLRKLKLWYKAMPDSAQCYLDMWFIIILTWVQAALVAVVLKRIPYCTDKNTLYACYISATFISILALKNCYVIYTMWRLGRCFKRYEDQDKKWRRK